VEAGAARIDFDGVLPPLAFGAARRILAAHRPDEVLPLLAEVEAAARGGSFAVGCLAYEAAPAFDRALTVRGGGDLPLAWFALHDEPSAAPGGPPAAPGPCALGPLVPELSAAEHGAAVARLREAFGRGDAYQANLTFRLRGPFQGDPAALYARLRAAQGGGFGALLSLGERAVVSASPELFLACRGRTVTARPMKGTAPRGRFLEEDEAAAAALAASEKDRAENVMIVDLVRNDLGRIAVPGSVRVARLCEVERYPTVLQLTSTVEAERRPGAGLAELLGATFPCGSVTGAPKAMAMRLLAAEERSPRGIYCGAVGVVLPGGDFAFNVPIRTAVVDRARGVAEVGVGGGITYASQAGAEHAEALAKAAFLDPDAGPPTRLVETLRLEGGRFPRLGGHLRRLAASARHLGFAVDPGAVERRLAAEAGQAGSGVHRVRLLVARDGTLTVERAPAPAPAEGVLPVALAAAPVSSRDRRLFHKTDRRAPYDAARAARPDVFDVLLWNEAGEVTEFTIGNVVAELGGERVTPPRTAGLLAGVLRAELLASGEVRERPIGVEEVRRAGRLWLVNALRGWVEVRLEP
jgi:para-aminobenzoate synthetase/4-amino-4-deoxychorismate lyase